MREVTCFFPDRPPRSHVATLSVIAQPIIAKDSRDGTLLLKPVQDGFGVLGIANGKLRYKGLVLTGFRQYLDLPYVNPQDNRMVPNTFEAITLTRPEGRLRFSTGYTWGIKTQNSDEFLTMTRAIGVNKSRGLMQATRIGRDPTLGAVDPTVAGEIAGHVRSPTGDPVEGAIVGHAVAKEAHRRLLRGALLGCEPVVVGSTHRVSRW